MQPGDLIYRRAEKLCGSGVENGFERSRPVQVTTIGVDLAKNVGQLSPAMHEIVAPNMIAMFRPNPDI